MSHKARNSLAILAVAALLVVVGGVAKAEEGAYWTHDNHSHGWVPLPGYWHDHGPYTGYGTCPPGAHLYIWHDKWREEIYRHHYLGGMFEYEDLYWIFIHDYDTSQQTCF